MNILTLGGTGFLSGAVVREAMAAGHRVWTVSRGTRPTIDGAIAITCDRNDRVALTDAIAQTGQSFDLFVDCIGYEPHHAEQDIALARRFARHFVFVSTDFVYDPTHRTVPQQLDNTHFEGLLPYGAKKRRCEVLIQHADFGDCRWTILRPCHIYGPGSELGCLPLHARDQNLINRLQGQQPIALVDGGTFQQQPIFAPDLARTILSCADRVMAHATIHHSAGPDIIASSRYYEIIAEVLGVPIRIESVTANHYLREHPETAPFLCDRVYDLSTLRDAGLAVPSTPIKDGLRQHVESIGGESAGVRRTR